MLSNILVLLKFNRFELKKHELKYLFFNFYRLTTPGQDTFDKFSSSNNLSLSKHQTILRARLVRCNGYYTVIGISITRKNKRSCNVITITILNHSWKWKPSRCLVVQLALLSLSNKDIQGSNPPSLNL